MKKDRASQTAYRVALSRAAHQCLDSPPVLDDPIALRIVGTEGAAIVRAGGRRFESGFARRLRAFFVARIRVAEDALSEAIRRGVRQFVILGAGLDTFAYRNPHLPGQLRIFEVDHPDTQAWKRKQLHLAKIHAPRTLTFVPVDFETKGLAEQLRLAGFSPDEPAFFSWLGVSMYLTPGVVMATIKEILQSTTADVELVFDYMTPISQQSVARRLRLRLLTYWLAAAGEPWRSFFEPDTLIRELRSVGFASVSDMGPDDINARYFARRADGLAVGGSARLIKARR